MSLHDPLTGLPARRLFLDRVREALRLADRRESRVALVVWRLLGPEAGGGPAGGSAHDRMMQATSRQLRDGLRSSDLVGRGGEGEFTLMLTGLDDEDGLREALGRLARRPSSTGKMQLRGRELEHRAGAALYPDHGARAEELLARAREAVERAAREGEELAVYRRTEHLEAEGETSEDRGFALPEPDEIRAAVEEERFALALQPVVGLRRRELEGMEALLRLPRDEAPYVPTRVLLTVLREHGMVEPADRLILEAVLEEISSWPDSGGPSWLSVNLTVETLSGDEFPDRLAGLLETSGVEADRLVVELAADDARSDPEGTRTAMRRLRKAGTRIALDEVGGGPLPLAPLGERPLHFLKLDATAVRDVHLEESRADLVQALVGLGHHLGARVVADGVASGDELRILARAGCDLAQGFHLGEPRPAGARRG